MTSAMDKIDRHWIRKRLTGRYGEQADLARAMGINSDKMSKILRGERQIKANELPGLLAFFDVSLDDTEGTSLSGFRESDAIPFTTEPSDNTRQLFGAMLTADHVPEVFVARTDAPAFAILSGDLLAVEMTDHAAPGDIILATIANPDTGEAHTTLRRYQPPWAIPGNIPQTHVDRTDDASGRLAIMGVVRSVLRRTAK